MEFRFNGLMTMKIKCEPSENHIFNLNICLYIKFYAYKNVKFLRRKHPWCLQNVIDGYDKVLQKKNINRTIFILPKLVSKISFYVLTVNFVQNLIITSYVQYVFCHVQLKV